MSRKQRRQYAQWVAKSLEDGDRLEKERERDRVLKKRPIIKLPVHILSNIGSFVCWVDNFALEKSNKSFKGCCRPLINDIYKLLSKTKIQREDFDRAISTGMFLSGSAVFQAMYGVRYRDSDFDFYYHTGEKHSRLGHQLRTHEGKWVENPIEMLVPPHAKYVTSSVRNDRDILDIHDEHDDNILPLRAFKYNVYSPEDKIIKEKNSHRVNTPTNTVVELVGVRDERNVFDFIGDMVDISIGKVLFGVKSDEYTDENKSKVVSVESNECKMINVDDDESKVIKPRIPKLHYRSMHHFWERKFSINWDVSRYLQGRRKWDKSELQITTEARIIRDVVWRLYNRQMKYIERLCGLHDDHSEEVCSNSKGSWEIADYEEEQTDKLVPEYGELKRKRKAEREKNRSRSKPEPRRYMEYSDDEFDY